jgi:hypothetical protein
VYDPPMTFTILSGRWVGNTGCPTKSSMKGGHPNCASMGILRFTTLGKISEVTYNAYLQSKNL